MNNDEVRSGMRKSDLFHDTILVFPGIACRYHGNLIT